MKRICLFIGLNVLGLIALAQGTVTNLNQLKPDELKAIMRREIVVVEYSEADSENASLEKKRAKAKGEKLDELNKRIAINRSTDEMFQQNLERIVRENWKHGKMEKLRVISHEEAKANAKDKSGAKYAMVFVRSFTKSASIYDGTGIEKIELSSVCFQGGEFYGRNTDVIAFPMVVSNDEGYVSETDLTTSVRILNRYVELAGKSDKRLAMDDFIDGEVAANCSLKKKSVLHFQPSFLKDATASDVKSNWPASVEMDKGELFYQNYSPIAEDAFAVFIPTQIGEGSFGPVSTQALIFSRLVVQPSTGLILGFARTKMGERAGELFYKVGHLEDIGSCGK
jgi:hypothetical protein